MEGCATGVDPERMAHVFARQMPDLFYKRIGYKLTDVLEELAYELGVENDKLKECKTRENPAKELLQYWANTPDTTVYVLYTVLNKLKQGSAIDVIHEYLQGEKVDARIIVHTNSSHKIHNLSVAPEDRLRDIVKTIPELANDDLSSIKCTMECAPKNPMDTPAKFFKGKQITLSTCDKQQRTSEPVDGVEVEQPSRHTTHKYPIQESKPSGHSDSSLDTDCSRTENGQNKLIKNDSDGYENLLNIWPALSSKQTVSLFQPRLNLPGTYILRQSREDKRQLSISIVSRTKKIINYRIHQSKGAFWIFEDQERFHTIQELVDYYSKHPLAENEQKEQLMLEKAL